MRRRVLVTRPEPGAARTAQRLEAMGFEAILLPLTETRPLSAAMFVPKDAASVVVTSANALRHAPRELVAALSGLDCHAVGKRTADVARAAGFASVHQGPGDACTLAAIIAPSLAGKRVVYLCGRVRFPAFEQRLAAAGISVHPAETYDTVPVERDVAEVSTRLAHLPVDIVTLYSAMAAEAVADLSHQPQLAPLFARATFLCLSSRVAATLASVDSERIRTSPEPNEEALLGLLPA